jgi:nucleoside-triphosphatase
LKNLFLTGKKGIGKTTLLKKVLDKLDVSIGGYTTQRLFEGYYRKYVAKSLYDNKEYPIIRVDSRDDSKVWFHEVFEENLVPLLDKSLERDLIVLDELGCSENNIIKFTSKVFEILDSSKIVFGVLKEDNCEFINNIKKRKDVTLITVTEENRDYLLDEILSILKSWI